MSIYGSCFYGVREDWSFAKPEIHVSLTREEREKKRTPKNGLFEEILFTATVCRTLFGKDYVVKLAKEKGGYEYIPLFEADKCYDAKARRWVECQKSEIPEKIMECYLRATAL